MLLKIIQKRLINNQLCSVSKTTGDHLLIYLDPITNTESPTFTFPSLITLQVIPP